MPEPAVQHPRPDDPRRAARNAHGRREEGAAAIPATPAPSETRKSGANASQREGASVPRRAARATRSGSSAGEACGGTRTGVAVGFTSSRSSTARPCWSPARPRGSAAVRAAEALHEGDRAGSRVANAHPARAQALPGEDATQGETQDTRDQRGFAREQKASPPRQREHPLAHRHVRQDDRPDAWQCPASFASCTRDRFHGTCRRTRRATRRRRRCSARERIRSREYRSAGNARTRPRRAEAARSHPAPSPPGRS